MPIRWVINPVDEERGEDGRMYRRPRVSTHGYPHSTVIMAGAWCLSFVRGADFAALAADPECVAILPEDYDDRDALIDRSLGDTGWTTLQRQTVITRAQARGVDVTTYSVSTPLRTILRDVGRQVDGGLRDIGALWVAGPGNSPRPRPTPQNLADDPADDFTESANTALTAHTPTGAGAGTGWTEEERTGTITARVVANVDRAEATTAEPNDRFIYTLQPDPSGAEYDIQATLQVSTITTSPLFFVARLTDASNYYSAGTYRASDANDKRIFKTVAGVVTELASTDSGIANGDVLLFEVRNATKKLYKNAGEELSTSDNVLTSPGRVGWGLGSAWSATDDIGAAWQIDNFSFTEVAPPFDPALLPQGKTVFMGSLVYV